MCAIFGLIDYGKQLTARQKNKIISVLARACEVRGTDATGIAYNHGGSLRIYKRPLPARKMRFRIPGGVNVVMGHTRLTTQGNEKYNQNNHPFRGELEHAQFALAHNGVLWNDQMLRLEQQLPQTSIETDSYVAAQLIEKQGTLDFDSLKNMAEKVEGSFTFTVLDEQDNVFLVKGDNPLTIYRYDGFLFYASTEDILCKAEKRLRIHHDASYHPAEGDIVKIDKHGDFTCGNFIPKHSYRHYWRQFPRGAYDFMDDMEITLHDDLLDAAKAMGVSEEDVETLFDYGCDA